MTDAEHRLLISQAAKLVTLGKKVEAERNALRQLVERGVGYDDPQVAQALEQFTQADAEWKQLEAEHLRTKKKMGL